MNKLAYREVPELPDWLVPCLSARNTDFDTRVVEKAETAQWQKTSLEGVYLRLLECVPGEHYRFAAQMNIAHGHLPVLLKNHPDLEVLMQSGHLTTRIGDYQANWYFRAPFSGAGSHPTLKFQRAATMKAKDSTLLYVAAGQMKESDNTWRKMDTGIEENWLPGPVAGTEVLPLHGHGACNVMLVRWNKTAAFKTSIDPRGEELLVLSGSVSDTAGLYPQNSWIRNPIAAWQPWGAKAGTVVYYKNGHFANS